MPAHYPIRAVARLTGIAVDTLRAWERRYQAVKPGRSARGRLYDDADVRRLVLLRGAVERGHAIGQVATLSDAELQELTGASFGPATTPNRQRVDSGSTAAPSELQSLVQAIERLDQTAANTELGRLALLLSSRDLVHRVVLPLMRLTGQRWERGTLQIAHEHMVSAAVRNLLGGLLRLHQGLADAPRMLLTTPVGEMHEFGILAAALLAVAEQYDVSYLGPNLPVRDILFAAAQNPPQVVVLAITEVNATAAVRDDLRQLAAEMPSETALWLGGSGAGAVSAEIPRILVVTDFTEFESHLKRVRSAG